MILIRYLFISSRPPKISDMPDVTIITQQHTSNHQSTVSSYNVSSKYKPGEFQHGLCGCFSNIGLCVLSFFLPCYTFGKVAEAVGQSCLLCGLSVLVPIANVVTMVMVRSKVREAHRIEGSVLGDVLPVLCCPFCSLVQEAQEVEDMTMYRY